MQNKLAKTTAWIIGKLWMLLAIVLVIAAATLTLLRFSLPHIPDVTRHAEQWLFENYDVNVEIGELSADWDVSGPRLVVNDIRFRDAGDSRLNISINSAYVALDFWGSVRALDWRVRTVEVSESNISFELDATPDAAASDLFADDIGRLLLQRLDSFRLRDSTLTLTSGSDASKRLVIDQLSWSNRGEEHQGVGQLRLSEFDDERLDFVMRVTGDKLDSMQGQLYVTATDFDLAPWLQRQIDDGEITTASMNFEAWLNFNGSKLSDGTLKLYDNRLRWRHEAGEREIRLDEGTAKLRALKDGWLVNSIPIKMTTIETQERRWELPEVRWQFNNDGLHQVSMTALPVAELLPLIALSGAPQQNFENLNNSILTGVADVGWRWQPGSDMEAMMRTQGLSWRNLPRTPNVAGAELQAHVIHGDDTRIRWQLSGNEVSIQADYLAAEPWLLPSVKLDGNAMITPDTWWLTVVPTSHFNVGPLELTPNLRVFPATDGQPQVALAVQTDTAAATDDLSAYYPAIMGEALRDYLRRAIQDGRVEQLSMLWRGPMQGFPYVEPTGVFQVQGWLSGLAFQFQPNWPALTNMDALLNVSADEMMIRSRTAELGDVNVSQANALIAPLGKANPHLNIQAQVSGDAEHAHDIFKQSPLADSVGAALAEVQLQGAIEGEVALDIPLRENAADEVVAKGWVDLLENSVWIEPIQQEFTNLSGRLAFNNEALTADTLNMNWYGLPLTTNLQAGTTSENDADYQVAMRWHADWQTDAVYEKQAELPGKRDLYGALNWFADFKLQLLEDADFVYEWDQVVDMTGLQSSLPEPFQKEFGDIRPTKLSVEGNQDSAQVDFAYADRVTLEAELDASLSIQSGRLQLGADALPWNRNTTRDFVITGRTEHLNIDAWQQVIARWQAELDDYLGVEEPAPNVSAGAVEKNNDAYSTLEHPLGRAYVQLEAGRVTWLGQTFDQVQIQGAPLRNSPTSGLRLEVNAEQTSTRVDYLPQLNQAVAVAKFLDIKTNQTTDEKPESAQNSDVETSIDWQSLPQLQLHCERCSLDDYILGDVRLTLTPAANGFDINQLRLQRDNADLALSGRWREQQESAGLTTLQGQLKSSDMGNLLSDFDIQTVVRDSPATIDFNLNWQGYPTDFNVASLNGDMQWQLGRGYLAEVSDGARLFSLLSLEGILRKLTLDFRDIFSNGMFYTEFGGQLNFVDGVVHTDNTRLDGSAGEMEVSGYTDLTTQSVDYSLTYVPKVTSSLPVILAWMINPPSGLAALLLDQVLQDAQVVSRLDYEISGTISEPIVEEVSRASRQIPLPETPPETATEESNHDDNER